MNEVDKSLNNIEKLIEEVLAEEVDPNDILEVIEIVDLEDVEVIDEEEIPFDLVDRKLNPLLRKF